MLEPAAEAPVNLRQNRGFILGSIAIGHGIAHLYDQGFPVFMPAITSSLGLSYPQVASLLGVRQAGSGVVNLGGGAIVDLLKSQWGLILTGCMIGSAISYTFVGASPNFAILFLAVLLMSVPGSLWHLPSTAALSQRFPDRRGFAIAMHGFGSNIGNVLGPITAGALLSVLFWRHVFFLYAIPALFLSMFVWWSLKDVGRGAGQEPQVRLAARFRQGFAFLKNPSVMGLTITATLRGIALSALFNWTPFYLEDAETGLGMSPFEAGVHYALVVGMGIVSAPILGALSDRFGRKAVMVPGAGFLGSLVLLGGDGWRFSLAAIGPGRFGAGCFCAASNYPSGSAGRGGTRHGSYRSGAHIRNQRHHRRSDTIPGYSDNRAFRRLGFNLLLQRRVDGRGGVTGDNRAAAAGLTA